jgi:hypothetical protein
MTEPENTSKTMTKEEEEEMERLSQQRRGYKRYLKELVVVITIPIERGVQLFM